MTRCVPLEPAAEAVCNQSAVPPMIFQMPPEQGRKVLEEAQDTPVYKYPARISSECIDTGIWGSIPVYFIVPKTENIRNIIFYIHGAGRVFGSFHTHEKLVRELAARTDSIVVFPEYSRSPEAKYPTAIEQCYFVFSHMKEIMGDCFPVSSRTTLTVAGDSVGGNMAIDMVLAAIHNLCRGSGSDNRIASARKPGLPEAFSADDDYKRTGGCFAQRRGGFWRKAPVRGCGGNGLAGTGYHSRFCNVERTGSDRCLPYCHGCVNGVGETIELKGDFGRYPCLNGFRQNKLLSQNGHACCGNLRDTLFFTDIFFQIGF